jgi:hypothetical protein
LGEMSTVLLCEGSDLLADLCLDPCCFLRHMSGISILLVHRVGHAHILPLFIPARVLPRSERVGEVSAPGGFRMGVFSGIVAI